MGWWGRRRGVCRGWEEKEEGEREEGQGGGEGDVLCEKDVDWSRGRDKSERKAGMRGLSRKGEKKVRRRRVMQAVRR